MVVRIAKKDRQEKPQSVTPLDLEGSFMKVFKPYVPTELQGVAFQKEDGNFKHHWTAICYNIYKDTVSQVTTLNGLLTRSETELVKCVDLLEAFGGSEKAQLIRANLENIKQLHKTSVQGKQNVSDS